MDPMAQSAHPIVLGLALALGLAACSGEAPRVSGPMRQQLAEREGAGVELLSIARREVEGKAVLCGAYRTRNAAGSIIATGMAYVFVGDELVVPAKEDLGHRPASESGMALMRRWCGPDSPFWEGLPKT